MAAAGHPGEDAALYDAVHAVGIELCPALGVSIPVGKDSLSMRTAWDGGKKRVVAPVSLIISAFAKIDDARRALTPELRLDRGPTALVLVDLGAGKNRLGGSVLAQTYRALGSEPPDLDRPELLSRPGGGADRAQTRRARARLSRPLGRRIVRDRLRNGICRRQRCSGAARRAGRGSRGGAVQRGARRGAAIAH